MILQSHDSVFIFATIALFAGASFKLLPSINKAVIAVQRLKYLKPLVDEMYEELQIINNINIDKAGQKISFSKNLILDKIEFSYSNSKKKILDGINLNIPKFSAVGLMGKTGSGVVVGDGSRNFAYSLEALPVLGSSSDS